MTPTPTTAFLATSSGPGAVGLIQLHGPSIVSFLAQIAGVAQLPQQRIRVVDLAGFDQGLAVRLREDWAQLMPHGGPRVVSKLLDRLAALGVEVAPPRSSRSIFPEAQSDLEADMLLCLSQAASPVAVDLLLAQPRLWRLWLDRPQQLDAQAILEYSKRMTRLIDPATVVVIGKPNVGKSTLTNVMLGRSVSMVADLPGTTRDWVAGLAQVNDRSTPNPSASVTVRWMDTPGLRTSDDPIETNAILLARCVIEQADVLIALRDPATDWPDLDGLRRVPDLWLINKIDELDTRDVGIPGDGTRGAPLGISVLHRRGLDHVQQHIMWVLGLSDLLPTVFESPWAFSEPLQALLERGQGDELRRYVQTAEEAFPE